MNAEPNVTDRALAQTDEAIAVASSAIADLWTMTAQRNELLAALKMVCDSGVALADPIERAMLAAIAKAEGRQ